MLPIWLLFLVPVWGALMPGRLRPRQAGWMWLGVGVLFAIVIGFRHEVGGDWGAYHRVFESTRRLTFSDALTVGDPGYYGLGWLIGQMGGTVYWLNFACASVLMWGTVAFSRRQPLPWLALLAAVPYMLVVVGMGYTRQSAALGFALLGLVALAESRVRTFLVFLALGALFHKSAVLLVPIAVLAASRNRWVTGLTVLVTAPLLYYVLLQDSADQLWANYVETQMQSEGAAIRAAMNALPAVILLLWRKRLLPDPAERRLWVWIAVIALGCIPLLLFASTAVDRVALYLLPLQMLVFARVPRLASATHVRTGLVLGIVGYYIAVQYVWLNFATHAGYWLPYQFMPLS